MIPAPLLLEVVRTAAMIGPVALALSLFGLNLARGAAVHVAGLRAAGALVLAGLLGWLMTYLLAHTFLWLLGNRRTAPDAQRPAASTRTWEA